MILSSPRLSQLATITKTTLFPGRCVAATYKLGDNTFNVVNAHNASLSLIGLRNICQFLEICRLGDFANPMYSASLLIGDMNFMAPGDRRFHAGRPMAANLGIGPSTSATFQHHWMRELKSWVEFAQPFPTNYSASGNSCARIDRSWGTIPPAHLVNLSVSSSVYGSPEDNEASMVSDHAGFDVTFSPLHRSGCRNIVLKQICKQKYFFRFGQQVCRRLEAA